VNRFVLDASMALGWFIDEPVPPSAIRARRSLANGGKALVPSYWHLEIANGLLVAQRRGLVSAQQVEECVVETEYLLMSVIESWVDIWPLRDALEAARSFGLTPYDALYLELARKEGIPLATLDRNLQKAATRAGAALFR
jgi:predicted nucleic acid-binding protein